MTQRKIRKKYTAGICYHILKHCPDMANPMAQIAPDLIQICVMGVKYENLPK